MDERKGEEAKAPPAKVPKAGKPRGLWARLRDALAAPDLTVRPQLPKSWARRITDEANPWLSAVQEQLQGDLGEAALHYLEDAQRELVLEQRARSALSLASAGFVLKMAGEDSLAIACYRGAARHFRAHADVAVQGSPRDALWSLERAAAFLSLGRLPEEVEELRTKYVVLKAALHPDQAKEVPDVFAKPKVEPQPPTAGGPPPEKGVQISRDYVARLERLLERL